MRLPRPGDPFARRLATVAALGLGAVGLTAAPASASVRPDTACARGWQERHGGALALVDPGPVPVLGEERRDSRLVQRPITARDLTLQSTVRVPVPWTGPGRIAGVATQYRGRERRLLACTGGSHPRAVGRPIALEPGERLLQVAVAGPWVAWATTPRPEGTRPTIRWRRLSSSRTRARTFPGRLTALVPATTGEVAVSVVARGRQRIVLLRPGGGQRDLIRPRRSAAVPQPRHGPGALAVWLWEPRTIAIAPAAPPAFRRPPVAPTFEGDTPRLAVELPFGVTDGGCRSSSATSFDVRSDRLRVQLTDSTRWARQALLGRESTIPFTRQHLRICSGDGRALVRRGVGSTSGGETEQTVMLEPSLVGDAVIGQTNESNDTSGSGSTRQYRYDVYARATPGAGTAAAITPRAAEVAVSTTEAAAWIERAAGAHGGRRLWVSDAAGVRTVPLTAPPARDVLLRLDGATLRVTTGEIQSVPAPSSQLVLGPPTAEQRIELEPLPAGATRIARPAVAAGTDSSASCPADQYRDRCESRLTVAGE